MSLFAHRRPTTDDILSPDFNTPWGAPTVPPFPIHFRDARIFTVAYRTDPDAVLSFVPPPLEPVSDVVLVHLYQMNDADWLGSYQEANVMVGVRLPGGAGSGGYSTHLFLNSDIGLAHGREVHGQPKKLARIAIETEQDLVVGRIARNGIDVLTATMPYGAAGADPAAMSQFFDFRTSFNLKAINHIDGRPAIRQITSRRLADVTVARCITGPCTVELRPNAQAPVWRLPVREPLQGWVWQADFSLVAGSIVHDYLAAA
jgi:acetoacetate decarboxylase